MNFHRVLPAMLLAACAAVASANNTDNPAAAYADSTMHLADVTVTAIKQASDISLQPVASTVIDARELRRWNVATMKSVSEIAPNFYIPDYGSRMTSSIYVRGMGARIDQPVVGLTVDNVTFLNKDNYDFDLIDIARIEVLRGPQSTLYGRNTMGGEINIYTLSPMQWQGTRIMAQGGTGPEARAAVSHYSKLSDVLAMSLAADYSYSDGFWKNHFNGKKTGRENMLNLRWKTEWNINAAMSLQNTASFNLTRDNGYPYAYVETGMINYNDTCYYRRNSFSDGLTFKWDHKNFTLSSITGVQYVDDEMRLDQDFLPLSMFNLTQSRHEWSLTQDIVIRGKAGCYSWLGGVFAFYRHTDMNAPVVFKQDGIDRLITGNVNNNDRIPVRLQWTDDHFILGSDFNYPVWGWALYHQSTVDLGRWSASLGLRLDYEKPVLDYRSTCSTGYEVYMKSGRPPQAIMQGSIDIDDSGRLKDHYVEFLPKFTLTYNLPTRSASNVYASVAKGYKSGGFNTQMFSEVLQQAMMDQVQSMMHGGGGAPGGSAGEGTESPEITVSDMLSYKPEMSWNYEVGAHIACADQRVMTDIALFYIDCRDQQMTMFPDGNTTGRITTNAGRTRSFGAEIQIRYAPTERWHFNAAYGYTNARFRRFNDGKNDYEGKYVPYAPQNTLFLSGTYNLPLRGWVDHLVFNANLRGVGKIYWEESNELTQPFYMQAGLSVGARHRAMSLDLWAENIANKGFDTFYFESINNRFVQRGKPRRFGATLRITFDSTL